MFAKTKVMRDTDSLGRIVSRLGHSDEDEQQRLTEAGVLSLRYRDEQGKNFLDNGKGGVFDMTALSERILDTFSATVCERNEVDKEFTVRKTFELMDDTMWAALEAASDDKGEFVLYNTVSFLMNDGATSMEAVAQAVMLNESGITKRVTTAYATAPKYTVERPHRLRASDLISEALQR